MSDGIRQFGRPVYAEGRSGLRKARQRARPALRRWPIPVPETAGKVGELMGMIGRIMPMQVSGRPVMAFAIVVTVSMSGVVMGGMAGKPRALRISRRRQIMMSGERHRRQDETAHHDGNGGFPQALAQDEP